MWLSMSESQNTIKLKNKILIKLEPFVQTVVQEEKIKREHPFKREGNQGKNQYIVTKNKI